MALSERAVKLLVFSALLEIGLLILKNSRGSFCHCGGLAVVS